MKTYNCIHCGKENVWGRTKTNKYCNNQCQADWEWINVHIPKIENGEASHHSATMLKKYLVEKFGNKCFECGVTDTWQNKPLTLQLEHADGNSDNNFPQNLKLLCPNCHSQTEFFGSKGQGSRYKKITKRNEYLRNYKKREVA